MRRTELWMLMLVFAVTALVVSSCGGGGGGGSATTAATPVCGNSSVETGEECDDGNTTSSDGCSATCANETVILTMAGTGTQGSDGDGGAATSAQMSSPYAAAYDSSGNVYVADNDRVRKIDAATGVITTVAGGNGTNSGCSGDGGAATAVSFTPTSVAVMDNGDMYIGAANMSGACGIRKVTAATGLISTVTTPDSVYQGNIGGFDSSGNIVFVSGTPSAYKIFQLNTTTDTVTELVDLDATPTVSRMTIDSQDNMYVTSSSSDTIRKIAAGTYAVTTIAGTGESNCSGDGGLATAATFKGLSGIDVDSNDNIYVVDTSCEMVRKIDMTTGIITKVAGTGAIGYSGDGGDPIYAMLSNPTDVAVADQDAYLLITDRLNYRVRKVTNP